MGDLKTPDVVRMQTKQTTKLDENLHVRNFFFYMYAIFLRLEIKHRMRRHREIFIVESIS